MFAWFVLQVPRRCWSYGFACAYFFVFNWHLNFFFFSKQSIPVILLACPNEQYVADDAIQNILDLLPELQPHSKGFFYRSVFYRIYWSQHYSCSVEQHREAL
jgi:hypothetical protein